MLLAPVACVRSPCLHVPSLGLQGALLCGRSLAMYSFAWELTGVSVSSSSAQCTPFSAQIQRGHAALVLLPKEVCDGLCAVLARLRCGCSCSELIDTCAVPRMCNMHAVSGLYHRRRWYFWVRMWATRRA